MDDDGPFYPLVTTLFWALRGWMNGEQARVRQNLAFIAAHGYDGIRILYDVNWSSGLAVHGTPTALAEFLSCARGEFGLRTKITVLGGGAANPVRLGEGVASVAFEHRDGVLQLEAVNEGNSSRADAIATAKALLHAGGIPVSVGRGDQGLDQIIADGNSAGTTVDSVHIERSGDWPRWIRQCWDFHALGRASDNGEPMGPGSSGVSCDDPFILATLRAGAIICGAGNFCLHTGSGIYGYTYGGPTGTRYANLWEHPNADAIFSAVRNADKPLSLGMENWSRYNTRLPLEVNVGRVEKQYGARSGKNFAHILTDTSRVIGFRENEPVESYACHDPSTGEAVEPRTANLRAYVLVGTLR